MKKFNYQKYLTSSGNIWVAEANGKRFAAKTKNDAEAKAEANKEDCLVKVVVNQYVKTHKSPMLVVGSNNWLRNTLPFFLIEYFDVHVLFYPNSGQGWIVGLVGQSRVEMAHAPVWAFGSGANIATALNNAALSFIAQNTGRDSEPRKTNEKQNLWFTLWIYRLPKITLKDLQALEPYSEQEHADCLQAHRECLEASEPLKTFDGLTVFKRE